MRDSVSIYWKSKKITCTQPLRGREEEFLTGNRGIALKELYQQCIKYYKDEETKKIVVKTFKKLFDNDYANLFSELFEETKKKNLNHHLQDEPPPVEDLAEGKNIMEPKVLKMLLTSITKHTKADITLFADQQFVEEIAEQLHFGSVPEGDRDGA